jgi:hypothetical protein
MYKGVPMAPVPRVKAPVGDSQLHSSLVVPYVSTDVEAFVAQFPEGLIEVIPFLRAL